MYQEQNKYIQLSTVLVCIVGIALLSDNIQFRNVFFTHDLRLWQGWIIVIAVAIISIGKFYVPRAVLLLIALVGAHSIIISILGAGINYFTIVQIILVPVTFVILYSVVKLAGLHNAITIYVLCALILSWSILIEHLLNIVSPELANKTLYTVFDKAKNGPWGLIRAHGLMGEPSHVALILPPALFRELMLRNTRNIILFTVAAILTFSGLTYLGLFIALLSYHLICRKVPVLQLFIVAALILSSILFVTPINDRVKQVLLVPQNLSSNSTDIRALQHQLGGSVGSLTIAAKAAWVGLNSNFMMGVGLGNFQSAGSEVVKSFDQNDINLLSDWTTILSKTSTGGSLIIRVIGELGILGIILTIYSFYKIFVLFARCRKVCLKSDLFHNDYNIHAVGMGSILFLTYMIRQDGYLNLYLLLPLAMYSVAYTNICKFEFLIIRNKPDRFGIDTTL